MKYSLILDTDEINELLFIFKDNPEWTNKIKNVSQVMESVSFADFSKNITIHDMYKDRSWMEPLPEKLHFGRKVKVLKGRRAGEIGIVTDHWINGDDCSGGFGNHLYQLEGDLEKYGCKNNSCAINVKDCELLD